MLMIRSAPLPRYLCKNTLTPPFYSSTINLDFSYEIRPLYPRPGLDWHNFPLGEMRGVSGVHHQGATSHRQGNWGVCPRTAAGLWWLQRRLPGTASQFHSKSCCQSVFAAFNDGHADAEKLLSPLSARGACRQRTESSKHPLHLFVWRRSWPALHRHALYVRWHTGRVCQTPRAAAARRGLPLPATD